MGNVYGYDLLAALFLVLFVLLMLKHPSNWLSGFESIQIRWHIIDAACGSIKSHLKDWQK